MTRPHAHTHVHPEKEGQPCWVRNQSPFSVSPSHNSEHFITIITLTDFLFGSGMCLLPYFLFIGGGENTHTHKNSTKHTRATALRPERKRWNDSNLNLSFQPRDNLVLRCDTFLTSTVYSVFKKNPQKTKKKKEKKKKENNDNKSGCQVIGSTETSP